MPKKGEMYSAAWWMIRDDDDGDGPYWYGYCEGDKDGDRLGDGEPLMMDPRHFPVGTRIDVSEPWDEEFTNRLIGERGKPVPATPAPWQTRFVFRMIKAARRAPGLLVGSDPACDWSDARLMAAAPDLLKALRGLLTCSLPHDISGRRFVEDARAAIAKATEDS